MPSDTATIATLIQENQDFLKRYVALLDSLAGSLVRGSNSASVKATLEQSLQGLQSEMTALLGRLAALKDQP
jgi:ethanolamine utilization microcompartment shell protein EutS